MSANTNPCPCCRRGQLTIEVRHVASTTDPTEAVVATCHVCGWDSATKAIAGLVVPGEWKGAEAPYVAGYVDARGKLYDSLREFLGGERGT